MTLIVGILCSDGVVMASDSAATYASEAGYTIGQQAVTKIHKAGDALYSSTGSIGTSQLLRDTIESFWKKNNPFANMTQPQVMNQIAVKMQETIRPHLQTAGETERIMRGSGQTVLCKSLLALQIERKVRLLQFDHHCAPEHATPELPFISLGSGQPPADSFLAFLRRVLWSDQEPTVAEGRFAAAWTISHVAKTNPGGVGGKIQVARLTCEDGRPKITLEEDEEEHLQAVEEAEAAMRNHVRNPQTTAPPPPTPT